MPTFISHKGIWHATKERVGGLIYKGTKSYKKEELPPSIIFSGETLHPGDPFIYDGIDREALNMLQEQGYDFHGERVMGTNFKHEPEFRQGIRNQGYNNIDEYLKEIGYNEDKDDQEFKEKASRVKSHEVSRRVKEIKVLAGGRNFAGEGDLIGGFGEERPRPASEVK